LADAAGWGGLTQACHTDYRGKKPNVNTGKSEQLALRKDQREGVERVSCIEGNIQKVLWREKGTFGAPAGVLDEKRVFINNEASRLKRVSYIKNLPDGEEGRLGSTIGPGQRIKFVAASLSH